MNYMLLMKKISEEVDVNNEDILAIKKIVSEHSLDIDKEEYEKKISKYSSGKFKDLYC